MTISNEKSSELIRTKAANDALAEFHLEVYSNARRLQAMRSGLLSNEDAIRISTFEHFAKGVTAILMSLGHANLFGGETKDEQINAMMSYAKAASQSSEQASSIMRELFEKLCSKSSSKDQEQKEQCENKSADIKAEKLVCEDKVEMEPEDFCAHLLS